MCTSTYRHFTVSTKVLDASEIWKTSHTHVYFSPAKNTWQSMWMDVPQINTEQKSSHGQMWKEITKENHSPSKKKFTKAVY